MRISTRINKKLNTDGYHFLYFSRKEHEKLLNKVKSDLNEEERSFSQYKNQMLLKTKRKKILLQIMSIFGIIPFMFYYYLKRILRSEKKQSVSSNKLLAIFLGKDEKVIPDSLLGKYNIENYYNNFSLDLSDILFIYRELILKRPFSFYYIFKVIAKIASYSYNIKALNPNAIIVTSEYSFTSSIMTSYCNEKSIKHINVMHGDKIFYIRDSFFKFNECYVWDEHYSELFINLRAEESQFIIEKPKIFELHFDNIQENNNYISIKPILTYYLQDQNEGELNIIKTNLNILKKEYNIRVRPHPKYVNKVTLEKYFSAFNIEYPEDTDIYQSIMCSEKVVSVYSTVLYQAYLNGKQVVIDDLINPKLYSKLVELDYIMTKKNFIKMSSLLTDVQTNYI